MIELRVKHQYNKNIELNFDKLSIKFALDIFFCPVCQKKVNILKTHSKICYSYRFGKFILTERVSYCKEHKYLINTNNIIKYYSGLVDEIVYDDYKITFDLIVKIGLLRYQEHKQLNEIKNHLKYGYASIDLSISTIGLIGKRFLEYCKLLHQKYEPKIRSEISSNGGYALHFDGTTEKQSKVIVFVVKDSISGHVLSSVKIQGESIDEIKPVIDGVVQKYGNPLLTQSDLKPGFKTCMDKVFDKKVLHIFCNYHFLRSFDDYFKDDYQLIKKQIASCRLKSTLSTLATSIKCELDNDLIKHKFAKLSDIKKYYEKNRNVAHIYCLVLYACFTWILKFKTDSTAKGFPFDLPYLDLYIRLINVKEFVEQININGEYKKYWDNFSNIVAEIQANNLFGKSIHKLKFIREWFQKLRAVLYMQSEGKAKESRAPLSERYKLNFAQLEQIPDNIEIYLQNLSNQINECQYGEKKILLRFQKKINKYKLNLTPTIHTYNVDGKEQKIILERTNNCLEQSFRTDKSTLRRITGREKLTREFNSVGELIPYYNSMKNNLMFKSMFEQEDILMQEFASLFYSQKSIPEMKIIEEVTKINNKEDEKLALSA
ncbi:MAG: hypothetical protein KAH72_04570 [Flavobacteriaceae bacterium]|nr:hypothetical protein [Flavobacteriaceae bacterium]